MRSLRLARWIPMEKSFLSEMIAEAQDGSEAAYESLLASYGPRLYGFFLRSTGNTHDAEDLLSEMMVRRVQRLGKYEDRGRFDQWLFRIAGNLVRDRLRRLKVRPPAGSLQATGPAGKELAEKLPDKGKPVGAELELAEESERLAEAMEKLDEKTRSVILLRHFGQLSFAQIAEIQGCPIGTALARAHRGLAALRALMVEGAE